MIGLEVSKYEPIFLFATCHFITVRRYDGSFFFFFIKVIRCV